MEPKKDKTEYAKKIIDICNSDLGYEDKQIQIENILVTFYKDGKRLGEYGVRPRSERK